jgi:hypothetical protein
LADAAGALIDFLELYAHSGAFSLHWSPYDRVRVVNADP